MQVYSRGGHKTIAQVESAAECFAGSHFQQQTGITLITAALGQDMAPTSHLQQLPHIPEGKGTRLGTGLTPGQGLSPSL